MSGKVKRSLTGSCCAALPSLWHNWLFQQFFRAKESCLFKPELSGDLDLFCIPSPRAAPLGLPVRMAKALLPAETFPSQQEQLHGHEKHQGRILPPLPWRSMPSC